VIEATAGFRVSFVLVASGPPRLITGVGLAGKEPMDNEHSKQNTTDSSGPLLLYVPLFLFLVYLAAFAVLTLYPRSVAAAQAIGLSGARLRAIYRPILWFVER
jgi:hypothetical protein